MTSTGCHKGISTIRNRGKSKKALGHEGVWGSGYIDPHFLDLGTSWS
jgi:hypothetical protein